MIGVEDDARYGDDDVEDGEEDTAVTLAALSEWRSREELEAAVELERRQIYDTIRTWRGQCK